MNPIPPMPPDPPDRGSPLTTSSSVPVKRHFANDDSPHLRKKTITDMNSASPSIQTTYTDPSFSVVGIAAYEDCDLGPFVVHAIRSESDSSPVSIVKPLKFGQLLHQNKVEGICIDGIKRVGRNKFSIQFKTASFANSFLENQVLKPYKFDSFIPNFNVTRMGVVRNVPTEWSMEEFVKGLDIQVPNLKVIKARRFNKKCYQDGQVTWEPTQSVVLTFRGQTLPDRVYIYSCSLPVQVYTFPTIQCMNCCRFGHIKTNCRSKPRCYRCAQPHCGDECSVPEDQASCLFCSGCHFSISKRCPEQDRQKSLKVTMSQEGISYQEASSRLPASSRLYSNVVAANSNIVSPSISYKKTVFQTPRPKAPLGKSYDKIAHQSLIASVPSSQSNGCAIQMASCCSPQDNPQEQLVIQLLTAFINIISSSSLKLPSNVANLFSQLPSLTLNNGSGSHNTMEL